MDHLKALLVFDCINKTGSLSAAARTLKITTAAVSQHLNSLEKHYGIKLMNRNTRSITPTKAGETVAEHAAKINQQLLQLESDVEALRNDLQGDVSISLPSSFTTAPHLQLFLQKLQKRHPNIQLCLHPQDTVIELHKSNMDIALRAADPDPNSLLIARYLTSWQLLLVATPEYLARHPVHKLEDLSKTTWIVHQDGVWDKMLRLTNIEDIPRPRMTYCSSLLAAQQLCLQGMGITLQLSGEVEELIAQGALQVIMPELAIPAKNIYAVTTSRDIPSRVTAVLSLLRECFTKTEKSETASQS